MKATTQYTDFTGTSAGDISDDTNLSKFLRSRGVNTERYNAIGAEFYHGYSRFFSASIICIDNEKSEENEPYIISISFENDFTHEEFFNLFKRFKVILTDKTGGFQDRAIDEQIIVDDRAEE